MESSYVVHNPLAPLAAEGSMADQDMGLPAAGDDYSPIPDVVPSQNSSPGSASDHMGVLPDLAHSSIGTAARTDASLQAPSWQSALESNVPRVVSTFVSDPDMIRSWNNASPITQQDFTGSNDSLAMASTGSSSPISHNNTSSSKPVAAHRRKPAAKPKREPDPTTQRRQKRLERNRESARLSRRRRKQYLEVLEERVTQFSHDLDSGRREHVSKAVQTIARMRNELLNNHQVSPEQVMTTLQGSLSRTSQELSVVATFLSQQLKSFNVPPSLSFILWLTLQSDAYFRGGRAHSERLSAARIGERVSASTMHW